MKTCCACKIEKTPEEFYKNKSRKDGLSTKCKDCSKAYSKAYVKSEEAKANNRKRNREHYYKNNVNLKNRAKKYGLTVEALERIIALNEICVICKARKATVIDHCHISGKVRGHLCSNCNTALGLFKDQPEWMRNAADYIEVWDDVFNEQGDPKVEFVTKEEYIARLV